MKIKVSRSLSLLSMAAPRSIVVDTGRLLTREEEEKSIDMSSAPDLDSPTAKRFKEGRFPLSRWEFAAAFGVILVFSAGLFCLYLSMPAAEYGKLKLPRTISDLRILKDNLGMYAEVYPTKFYSWLLLNIHIHADIYDSWDNFHVLTC